MTRLIEYTVVRGRSTAWARAGFPIAATCPDSSNPTTEGSEASPSAVMIAGPAASARATSEFVVPRSMPTMMSRSVVMVPVGVCVFAAPRRSQEAAVQSSHSRSSMFW